MNKLVSAYIFALFSRPYTVDNRINDYLSTGTVLNGSLARRANMMAWSANMMAWRANMMSQHAGAVLLLEQAV